MFECFILMSALWPFVPLCIWASLWNETFVRLTLLPLFSISHCTAANYQLLHHFWNKTICIHTKKQKTNKQKLIISLELQSQTKGMREISGSVFARSVLILRNMNYIWQIKHKTMTKYFRLSYYEERDREGEIRCCQW